MKMPAVSTWPRRRWYLAWLPGHDFAVVRAKDEAGLQEWREREWRDFPEPPIITDVTEEFGAVLATLAAPVGESGVPDRRCPLKTPQLDPVHFRLTVSTDGDGRAQLAAGDASSDQGDASVVIPFTYVLYDLLSFLPVKPRTPEEEFDRFHVEGAYPSDNGYPYGPDYNKPPGPLRPGA